VEGILVLHDPELREQLNMKVARGARKAAPAGPARRGAAAGWAPPVAAARA
jgi:hypothetical protein